MASLTGKTSVPYNTMSESHSPDLFTNCCFCIPLRVACFIIGYLNLIGSCIYVFVITYLTILVMTTNQKLSFDTQMDVEDVQHARLDVAGAERNVLNLVTMLMIFLLFLTCCWLIVAVVCIIGVHKKRVALLKMYIRFAVLRIVTSTFIVISLTVRGKTELENTCVYFVEFALSAYFILVFHVYAKRLEREQNALKHQQLPFNPNDVYLVAKVGENTLVA